MKKIFSQITSYLVAASLVTSPLLAQAQSNSSGQRSVVPERFQKEFERDKNFLGKMGYENIKWDDANNRALVYGDKGKLLLEMPYTGADELRKYSPSNLEARLLKEMAQFNLAYENTVDAVKASPKKVGKASVKAGNYIKGKAIDAANTRAGQTTIKTAKVFGGSFGAAWSHAAKRLPAESAMFFMAMGAVAAGQLFLNYSQNPVAFQQHLEHQLSPLGVIGFWSFMLTQGIASNVLMSYMGNSKLRFMIPYLGMTVGFFVQSWLSQVLADPNVMVCAKSMIGMKPTQKDYELGAVEKPCDAAYEYLVVRKQLRVLAPGLASMLLSSAAAAVLQKGAQMGAARLGFMELAILLTPGQMQIKGIRAVIVHGLQITTFVALDAWFNRWVTAAWKNTFDGKGLLYANEELVEDINAMKQGNWKGDEKELIDKVKEFKGQMADWRMMNLASVYEAHANWSSALGKMTGTYNASKQFYEDFGDQIRNSQYNLQVMKPLQQIYPLKGVLADGLPRDGEEPRDENSPPIETLGSRYFRVALPTNPPPATPAESDMYFTFPKNLESQQVKTVEKAVIFMEYKLANSGLKMNPAEEKAVKKSIADLRAGLKSYSLERGYYLGRAIYEFNRMRYNLSQSRSQTQDFAYLVGEAYKMMGKPDPMLAPGRGWITTYSEAPTNKEHLEGAAFDHSKHQVGVFAAPTVGDKFVMQMLCGPDANSGQMLTEDKWGFPATFTPPRIHTGALDVSAVCDPGFAKANSVQLKHPDLFYTETVNKIAYVPDSNRKAKNNAITTTYRGYLEYMIDNSIAAAIGNADHSTMKDWWERTTETQMVSAFEVYSRSYNEIIAELLEGMFKTNRHILNKAPFANGVVQSIREQEDVYYTMLSEMLYPSKNEFALHVGQKRKRVRMHPALVKVQRQFDILVEMMEQIKVVPAGQVPDTKCRPRCPGPVDYLRIASDLENTDIDKQVENVKLTLSKVAQELGIASAPVPAADAFKAPSLEDIDLEAEEAPALAPGQEGHPDFVGPLLPKGIYLNKAQAAFATEVLEGLDALAQEFSTYARIANAVTWDKVQHMKESSDSQNDLLEKIKKMKSSIIPGM